MNIKIDQFSAINSNPVLSVTKDGIVLYSNEACKPLLKEWCAEVGEKLPSYIVDLVQGVIFRNNPDKMEVKVGKSVYLIVFHPLPEQECVNISGFDISGQKELEEELRESENRYRNIVKTSVEGIWVFNSVSETTYVNEKMADMLGYNREEMIGSFIWDYADEEEKDFFQVRLANRKRGIDEVYELKLIHKDGSPVWVSVSAKGFIDDAGKFAGSVGMFTDITERKRAEQELRESEERFRSAFDDSAIAMALVGPDARLLKVNNTFCQLLGFEKAEMEGHTFIDFTYPDDIEPSILIHKAVINREKPLFWLEKRYIRKDGRVIWCEVSSSPVFDSKGCPIYTVAHIQDITERKRAEETLAFERSQLLSIFDGIDDVVYVTDPYTYEVLYANKAMKEKFGGELVGGTCYQEFQRKDSPCDFCTNQIILKEKGKPYHWEYYNPTVDRYFMIMDRIIKWPDGRDVRFEIAKDITERKRTEEALLESEANRKVSEAIEVERQRLYNVLETLPAMICLLTPDYRVVFSNRSFREKFGISVGRHCYESRFGRTQPCEFCESYKVFETGQARNWKGTTPDGSVIDTYDLPFTDFDGTPMILKMDIDITGRSKAEEALANIEIARQKEIHHRIKNNLQVISSLLDLQADKFNNREYIKCSEVLEAFKESQNRVISMALIHEELHKGERLEMLNFSSYIEELADNLILVYRLGKSDINLNMDLEHNIFFDMDIAIPLGIIINELISNSLKHAFSDRNDGEIRINLHREEGNNTNFILIISDNGIGIPENLDVEDLNSLGLQLVTTLVNQLDGELEINRNSGTEFIIKITVCNKVSEPQLIDNE